MPRTSAIAPKRRVSALTAIGVTIATLYFAREVLIPLALAVLLAFLLAPVSTRLERLKFGRVSLGRVASVLIVVTAAFAFIFGLGWVVGNEVVRLAHNLPVYQTEIVRKAERLGGSGSAVGGNIARLGEELEKATAQPATTQPAVSAAATQPGIAGGAVNQVAKDPVGTVAREVAGGPPAAAPSTPGTTPANPLFTVGLPAPVSPIKTLATYLGLVLGPLGTAGLVIVFVIFLLLEREEMRDRVIRLVSRGKYLVTTRAINDAATRISRYMLAQSVVNGTYGVTVAVGLWLIGLTMGDGTAFPSFILWGVLCALLRFIPYVGPWIAAAFPIAVSLAVYPGFGVFAAVAGAFVIIELLSNNVMEPWLYGASTGISTMAIIVAAVFWTWLWGPVGLLLSTPLTVCIVVLGKHVAQLQFLDVLLGDQPALPPSVSYYQRLLARDKTEAADVTTEYASSKGLENVPDEVLIPALLLARRDRQDGDLTADDETFIFDMTREIIARLAPKAKTAEGMAVGPRLLLLGCPSHHRTEELILHMLPLVADASDYDVEVISTRTLPAEIEARIEREAPAIVFVAVLPPGGAVQARYLCKRLRKRFKDLKIVVGYWGRAKNFDRLLVSMREAGASYVTTSLLQTRSQIRALLSTPAPAPRQAASVPSELEQTSAAHPAVA
jgi:predicted PurR-regulated permease PerM